jgi:phage terminase large subunit GpA-like protein
MCKAWSKDRLTPMLRDTPVLQGKVSDPKRGDSTNTTLHKIFPGGHITIAGSNSPASLASRPIRLVLCDEIDRYEATAGSEGDPIRLAEKRAVTFWNRKKCKVSTPTIMGNSRIEREFERSDQRRFFVPCSRCGEKQILKWQQVRFDPQAVDEASYQCEKCGGLLTDWERMEMVKRGEWRALAPFRGIAGFHISELYSPFVMLEEMCADYVAVREDPAQYQVWVNTTLGETYDDSGDPIVDDGTLYGRREQYGPAVPLQGLVLTAGVDVQDDRLEVEVVAWGAHEESWSMDYEIFHGNTGDGEVWKQLDNYLLREWIHETGAPMKIACACIDSGYQTQAVYSFVSGRQSRSVYATKGSSYTGKPLISKPTRAYQARVRLYTIGTDTAKQSIYARLKLQGTTSIEDSSEIYKCLTDQNVRIRPGMLHFPMKYDEEYFKQLTGEKVEIRKAAGYTRRVFVKRRDRQEALDCRVYAYAAFKIAERKDFKFCWRKYARALAGKKASASQTEAGDPRPEAPETPRADPRPQRTRKPWLQRPPRGWVNKW